MAPVATVVVIVGAGNMGRLVHDCLQGDDRWTCMAFHDDGLAGGTPHGLPIRDLGLLRGRMAAILAVGDPATRRTVVERLEGDGPDWQTFIDRRSMVGTEAALGRGTLVLSFAMVASGVVAGPFCYFSAYSHAGTGSSIGAYTSLLAGASVGESVVGAECVPGLKSVCLDGAVLGDRVMVAPVVPVWRGVPDDALVAGNPARVFRRAAPRASLSAPAEKVRGGL